MIQQGKQQIRLQIILFTLIRTAINTGFRMVYPLLPLFAIQLGVSIDQLALGLSVRAFLGILAPFLAAIADTRGRKAGMLLGVGLFTLGTGLTAALPGFVTFILGSSLVIIGNGIFIPSMQAYLSDRVAFERRGTVLSITELSWALAFIISVPIVNALMLKSNYAIVFLGLTALGLILNSLLFWRIPHDEQGSGLQTEIIQNFKKVLSYSPAIAGILMGVLFTSANEIVNLVFGDWIKQAFGLTFATLSVATVVIGASEMGSELLSVALLDRLGKKRSLRIALGLNCLAAALLPLTSKALSLALVGLGAFYITFEFALISGMTLMSEVMPQARATLMSITIAAFSLGRMVGSLVGPSFYRIDFWVSCLAAVGLNIIALLLLTRVKVHSPEPVIV